MVKKILLWLGAALAGLVLLWTGLTLFQVPLPADFLRAGIEQDLNQDLAPLQVRLKGPLTIIPAWGLDVRAQDIEVTNPQAKGGPRQVAQIAKLDLVLALMPLFSGEVDLRRLSARQLKLTLVADGAGLLFPLVEGHLNLRAGQIRLDQMVIDLGKSRLTGAASLSEGKPPRLVVELDSPRADLEDVYAAAGLGRSRKAVDMAKSREELLDGIDRALHGILGNLEGHFSLRAQELRLRGAVLGRAHLKLSLKGKRLILDPMLIELPGGKIEFYDEIVKQGANLASEVNLEVRNFAYGGLVKHADPKTDLTGKISLRIALSSAAPRMSQLLANAEGIIQVGIWPKDLKEKAYSLWAANLIFGLLRSMTQRYDSKVNCAIGDFVIKKGMLTQRKLIIDTTKVRVSGEAKVNFKKRTVSVDLEPRAKTPQFFSLETPITIQGTFADFSAGVAPSGLVGSVIKFAASPIFAPLRRLFGDTLPEAGKDVCMTPETWPPPAPKDAAGKNKRP